VADALTVRIIKLTVEYDGTAYCGWQRQRGPVEAGPPSIQATLEAAVLSLTGASTSVVGAGRTDAGVHAYAQVAHFATASRIHAGRFAGALNAHLPPDIRVLLAAEAPAGFHARFDARSRSYRYEVLNRPAPSALLRHRAYHVPEPIDVQAVCRALAPFIGRHDFAAYRASGSRTRTTTCDLLAADCNRKGARVWVTITADRFLRHMVRLIVGTLLRVGTGRLPEEAPGAYLRDPDSRRSGPAAPAHGLYLLRVDYSLPPAPPTGPGTKGSSHVAGTS
jgi:tRNA pseudouridine38-40 synthase